MNQMFVDKNERIEETIRQLLSLPRIEFIIKLFIVDGGSNQHFRVLCKHVICYMRVAHSNILPYCLDFLQLESNDDQTFSYLITFQRTICVRVTSDCNSIARQNLHKCDSSEAIIEESVSFKFILFHSITYVSHFWFTSSI